MIVMLKAGRRFSHVETGPTFEGKEVSACLGEVACFLGNLVGTLAIATTGRLEWNWRIHHHPYQRGQRTLISFQLKPKVPMFIRHSNRWRVAKAFSFGIHQGQHQVCLPLSLPWTTTEG